MAQLKGGTTGQILSKTSATDMAFTWITNDVGDITAVTAGTGISGGGTSGAVTVTNSMATAITTAGDLIKGTGSGTFDRLGIGSTGQVLTVTAGAPAWATPSGGGKVLQVVYARTTTEVTQSSTTYATTGLSASITPSSASSKVLCLVKTRFEYDTGTSYTGGNIQLWRGGSSIVQLDNQIARNASVSAQINLATTSHYLDSPATTSAITYTVYGAVAFGAAGNTIYWQGNSSQSDIVLMEIGA
jgi:hypothetical protein